MDLSESAHSAAMSKLYADAVHTIATHITHGDALLVGRITDHSATELDLPINESFSPFEPGTDNELYARDRKTKADEHTAARLQAIETQFAALLADRQRRVMRTDIFGSLELAERVFHTFGHPRKVLVLLSDMVQDAEGIDFAREDLSPARARALIERLRKEGRIPDLKGVSIYVAGAGSSDLARARAVRDFWLSYFKAARAGMAAERYGGPLIRFEE